MGKFRTGLSTVAMLLFTGPVMADSVQTLMTQMTHAQRWNRFADKLLELHKTRLANREIRTTEHVGSYSDMPDFFRDVHYYDKKTNRLLSRVQWETRPPNNVHNMEVYFYDRKGRVLRDFGVAYLTNGREAPMQTMINFHAYSGKLHAFRQFDASNNRTFERCEGTYRGKEVDIHLDEGDILEFEGEPNTIMTTPLYKRCFGGLPLTAGKYLTPQ